MPIARNGAATDQGPPYISSNEALRREIVWLRELLETRMLAAEVASETFKQSLERVPTETTKQVANLQALMDEKFEGVFRVFEERAVRAAAAEDAAKVAVAVGLSAAKEAVAQQNAANAAAVTKSEVATTKQIDAILTLLSSNAKAVDERLGFINGRLDRSEGTTRGQSDQIGRLLAVGALVVSVVIGANSLLKTTLTPVAVVATPRGLTTPP